MNDLPTRLVQMQMGQRVRITPEELDSMLDEGSNPNEIVSRICTVDHPNHPGEYIGWIVQTKETS